MSRTDIRGALPGLVAALLLGAALGAGWFSPGGALQLFGQLIGEGVEVHEMNIPTIIESIYELERRYHKDARLRASAVAF